VRKVVQTTALILFSALALAINAGAAHAAPTAPLGVVVVGQKALLGGVYIADGTSLFDGDTVSTEGKGSLRIRLGASQLFLGENSALTLLRSERGVTAKLLGGTARFSGAAGAPIELMVLDARIRGKQDTAAGQVTMISNDEFQVGATSGSLTVDVEGDVRTVDENTAYDATLSPVADNGFPVGAGRRRSLILWILIGLAAVGTVIAITHATMSHSKMN
jgi:hypothetical protein